jgi:peptide-methionine (S)-S-oxide reductase
MSPFSRLFGLFAAAAALLSVPAAAAPAPRALAVFAGGCFWCTESDFDHVPGVLSTTSGYTGGTLANPTYEQVSAGGSGHFESVRVLYDPTKVNYATLVTRFLRTVDAVDAGGQFCDRGSQYRSAIFVADPEQRRIAAAAEAQAAHQLKVSSLATLILPAGKFYPAEGYHQDYYKKNPIRYRFYRYSCGRDARVKALWGASAH